MLNLQAVSTQELVLVDNSGNAVQTYTNEQCLVTVSTSIVAVIPATLAQGQARRFISGSRSQFL